MTALCEKCGRNFKVTKHTEAYCQECPKRCGLNRAYLLPSRLQEWLDENYPERKYG